MDYVNLAISIAAVVFSLIALVISYRKLKLGEEELKLTKLALERDQLRYENSTKKFLEISIHQAKPLDLNKNDQLFPIDVTLVNKSAFPLKVDAKLVLLDKEHALVSDLPCHYEDFEDILLPSKDKFSRDYVIMVNTDRKSKMVGNFIKAVATDPEGETFESSPLSITTRGSM